MKKCKACSRISFFSAVDRDELCNSCGSESGRLAISKSIIDSTLLGASDGRYQKYIKSLVNNKQKGQEIISLLSKNDTQAAHYYKARAYQLLGAKFRQDQIDSCNTLIKSNFDLDEHESIYILNLLAEAYEGEYLFDEAINTYEKLLKKHKGYSPAQVKIAYIMVKQNRLDDAIAYLKTILKELKSKPYYYTDPLTKKKTVHYNYKKDLTLFAAHIKELEEKKEKGYVYKPRKR